MQMKKLGCLLLLIALLVWTGCSEEDTNPIIPDNDPNIPDSSLPFPDTPDQLLANFHTIYETMDADEYRLILDPAFVTLLQPHTINDFPHVGVDLDVTEERRIHDRLFSGESQTGPGGEFIPAISQFSFSRLTKIVDWGPSLPTDPIPDTLSSLYDVEILADRGQAYSTLKIEGQIRFYVTTTEGRLDGQPRTYYRLVGQLDLTSSGKGVEEIAWGSLKAYYH